MESMRPIEGEAAMEAAEADAGMDAPPAIGADERRMHVRAYNYWVSLLAGRPFPAIQDLTPSEIADFGPHSVLLDFSGDPENPAIVFLGHALRAESGHDADLATIAEVPGGTLLSRLTDHYLEIIANRAPIGFEAEFTSRGGTNTLYRGILMPFSSGGDSIDFVYGVINWKEVASVEQSALLAEEMARAMFAAPGAAAAWADGPNAASPFPIADDDADGDWFDAAPGRDGYDPTADIGLADRLALARETADAVRSARARTRAALYRALGLAYDFALVAEARPEEYAELLADCGMKAQARAPMTPVVKLVFGVDYDKTRLTEFAAALSHARRTGIALGGLHAALEAHEGGLKGMVAAERAARRPAALPPRADPRAALRAVAAAARVRLEGDASATAGEEYLLLVGRREADGSVAILQPAAQDGKLLERVLRHAAR
ncbi:PAS domain-containing protein [Edaphosphingomonas haloaromaticamans]|nr:hypothetical protein [Sphingomonas haloaromaticamans]